MAGTIIRLSPPVSKSPQRQPINGARLMARVRAQTTDPLEQARQATALVDRQIGDWPRSHWYTRLYHSEVAWAVAQSLLTWVIALGICVGGWWLLVMLLVL
jgi:hypothetical protein